MAHARTIGVIFVSVLVFSVTCFAQGIPANLTESPREEQLDVLNERGYRPSELVSAAERQRVENRLREYAGAQSVDECDFGKKVGSFGNRRSIARYDQVIADMTPFILQNYSRECVANLLAHYMAEKFRHPRGIDGSWPCLYDRNSTNENTDEKDWTSQFRGIRCPRILEEKGLFELTSARLSDALFNPSADLRVCAPNREDGFSSIDEFSEFVAQLTESQNQVEECTEVGVNETRMRGNKDFSLTRNGPNEYTANLVMDFSQMYQGASNQTPEEMLQRVQTCLNATNDLYQSSNGEKLNFNILGPESQANLPEEDRLEEHPIRYQAAEFRQTSRAYSDTISCSVIAHEVFHLLGLLDEYHEEGDGTYFDTSGAASIAVDEGSEEFAQAQANGTLRFQPVNNSCRAIPDQPSVMSNHKEAFRQVASFPTNCECDPDNEESAFCRAVLGFNNTNLTRLMATRFIFPNFNELCDFDSTGDMYFDGQTMRRRSPPFSQLSQEELNNLKTVERVSTTPNSVSLRLHDIPDLRMDLSTRTYTNEFWDNHVQYYQCTCEGKNIENCEEKLEDLRTKDLEEYNQTGCFESAGTRRNNSEDINNSIPVVTESESLTQTADSFSLVSPTPNPGAPLLHPAHMTFIKFAGCKSRATKYRTCQSYAYVNECPGRPAYCDEEEQWLMQEQ